MNEKLQWEHIRNYVPNLKARLSDLGIFNLDSEYPNPRRHEWGIIDSIQYDNGNVSYGTIRLSDGYSFDFETLDEIEIGLYSFDYLTKEIEVNGERFIHILSLLKICINNIDYKATEEIKITDHDGKLVYEVILTSKKAKLQFALDTFDMSFYLWCDGRVMTPSNQLQMFQKLFEWNFDVFGLIEKDLAVNINEINKEHGNNNK